MALSADVQPGSADFTEILAKYRNCISLGARDPPQIAYARVGPKKLPVALSLDEVVRFLEAVPGLESRAALTGPTFRAFLLALMKT
jgi:hypothetical protein